ncbi:hypothetical protein F2P56_009405 [Juglans regia]|uniref:Phytocyanin domain-containing protein n=2 Tax=Juglans regia TaxID=51240 RepID=A0A833XX29_JUGRE|nr:umecyanin-like [Juglans regia]KAF5472711.1 hypothetical protein F2P56_009405 [Juglans regia]
MAAMLKMVVFALFIISVSLGGKWVGAQVHHVVGDDRGWDPASDLSSWSSGKTFRVGDKIWFTYSSAKESIAEVKSKEEYEACDVSNPIKMYTDGLESISLDGEGVRYFASSKAESCRNGLKLHVEVLPQGGPENIPKVAASKGTVGAVADGPTTPSGTAHLMGSLILLAVGFLCYVVGV